jgi:hypothetical protein
MMKSLRRHAIGLAVLVSLVSAIAQPALAATRSVVVTVVDGTGQAVSGVSVVVACDREFAARSDDQGQVKFQTSVAEVQVTVVDGNGKTVAVKSAQDAVRVELKGRS